MSHEGKTVLVTGGGGGLGRALAEHFLSLNCNVVTCDINETFIEDFNKKVTSTKPDHALAVHCDITSEAALDDLFTQAEKKFGHFDYVVNSAGVMDKFTPSGEIERGEWDRVIAVNLTAPTMITKRAVNGFLAAGKKGAIVNIGSVASFKGFANGVAYTASKHALIGLTKSTAAFYRLKGIRCNVIAAGGMQTNIQTNLANGYNEEGMAIMMKSFGNWEGGYVELSKMAKLVEYLCSEDSSMLNGAMITADGGITAC